MILYSKFVKLANVSLDSVYENKSEREQIGHEKNLPGPLNLLQKKIGYLNIESLNQMLGI